MTRPVAVPPEIFQTCTSLISGPTILSSFRTVSLQTMCCWLCAAQGLMFAQVCLGNYKKSLTYEIAEHCSSHYCHANGISTRMCTECFSLTHVTQGTKKYRAAINIHPESVKIHLQSSPSQRVQLTVTTSRKWFLQVYEKWKNITLLQRNLFL
jgi:hypothetical protein